MFLALQFTADVNLSFSVVVRIIEEVQRGWILRILHANGASFFFLCLYLHVGRGLYYSSFHLKKTWLIGLAILLISIATAFLGYVLPWGQISFWGTTVITNLLSAIPYVGEEVVIWLWGGFAVINPTLTRFFAFHFLCPFIISFLVILHVIALHLTGSNNPLGILTKQRINFFSLYVVKDLLGIFLLVYILILLIIYNPWILGDPENFMNANPLVTPVHIQPEWYFLFAYAILRSIPNKLGGVVGLIFSVCILGFLPFTKCNIRKSTRFYPLFSFYFWRFIFRIRLLVWIGARPVEEPYVFLGQILTFYYFLYFYISNKKKFLWDEILQ